MSDFLFEGVRHGLGGNGDGILIILKTWSKIARKKCMW